MRGYQAYKQTQTLPPRRIDVILGLFSSALENLERARQVLAQQGIDSARPFLLKSQLAVMGLASGLPAHEGELAGNFLRLYEYALYQMSLGTTSSIDEATKVLRTLSGSFQQVRDQAVSLELNKEIRPLEQDHLLSINV